jgi:hypothetical protein
MPPQQVIAQKLVACGLDRSAVSVAWQDGLQSIEIVIRRDARASSDHPPRTLHAAAPTLGSICTSSRRSRRSSADRASRCSAISTTSLTSSTRSGAAFVRSASQPPQGLCRSSALRLQRRPELRRLRRTSPRRHRRHVRSIATRPTPLRTIRS